MSILAVVVVLLNSENLDSVSLKNSFHCDSFLFIFNIIKVFLAFFFDEVLCCDVN